MKFKRLCKALMLTIIIILVLIMIVMISAAICTLLTSLISPEMGRLLFVIAIFMLFVGICYDCFC